MSTITIVAIIDDDGTATEIAMIGSAVLSRWTIQRDGKLVIHQRCHTHNPTITTFDDPYDFIRCQGISVGDPLDSKE